MAQSTDKTLKQLIINQMPRSVYNAKKAVGELDPEQVYLPDTAYDDSLGVTDAVPGKTIKVKAVQGGKPTEWETADIYEKPASGIPKSDLANDVQTSLAKADAAISLGLTAATPGQIIKVKTVQDGKPTEWEAVDDRLPKVSASDAGNVLGVEQIGEHEYGYALTHMPTLSDFIPLGIINASPGQFAKVSSVDDFGGPTAWETADIYEKPTSGIPKSDLAQSVQDALDRTWNNMEGKPFSEIGEGLKVDGGKLTVDTTDKIEQGNIKPVTSAAVYTVVGNINAILATI